MCMGSLDRLQEASNSSVITDKDVCKDGDVAWPVSYAHGELETRYATTGAIQHSTILFTKISTS
jgi:hypothetical protein